MKLTCIIPTLGREIFHLCLKSLLEQSRPPDTIVIVTPRELKIGVENRNSRLIIVKTGRVYDYAVNIYIGYAISRRVVGRSDLYLASNDDVIYRDRRCVEKLVETFREVDNVGIVAPLLYRPSGSIDSAVCGLDIFGFAWELHGVQTPRHGKYIPVEVTSGASMMISSSLVEKRGFIFNPFLEAFAEDIELCLHARALGYRVLVRADTEAIHVRGVTYGRASSRKIYLSCRNMLTIWEAVLGRVPTLQALSRLGTALLFLAGGDVNNARTVIRAVYDWAIYRRSRQCKIGRLGQPTLIRVIPTFARYGKLVEKMVKLLKPVLGDYRIEIVE